MNGGWQTLTDATGQLFANQGLCIDFAIHHPVSLADLATSSFTGTTSGPVPTAGCGFPLVEGFQTFDGSYPGSGSVGTVNLHLAGCASFSNGEYSGSFTITTSVGTLSGSASGPISGLPVPSPILFELTLSVMTGTDSFAGTSGTLQVPILWLRPSPAVSGSVTPS
jgi:hypothetical protein